MSMELGPYTNFHELNQDWFLNEFNSLIEQWKSMQKKFDNLNNAFNDLKSYVNNYFKNLDVQEEINNKLDAMISDGTLITILSPTISTTTSNWLNTHITNPSNPPIDTSLTIKGAAADSKTVGDILDVLKAKTENLYPYPFKLTATLLGNDNKTPFYTPEKSGIKNIIIHNHGIADNYYIQTFYKITDQRVISIRANVKGVTDVYMEYIVNGEFTGIETFTMKDAKYDITAECTINWDNVNAGYGQNLTVEQSALDNSVIDNSTFHIIVVDINGTGDYTKIQDAVDHAQYGDIVFVKSGWYNESVVNTKQIAIIGQDKFSTVLYNTTGEYATPPLWSCSGMLENITIYAYNESNKSFDTISNLGYAMHLDQKWDNDPKRRHIEIRNCIFKSDFGDAIGCGMDADSYIEISDTICEATHKSGMKVHPFPTTGKSKIVLKNNVFKKGVDDNGYGLMFHTGGTDGVTFNTIEVEAYYNIAKTFDRFDERCFIMNEYNYGNTLESMNKFSIE